MSSVADSATDQSPCAASCSSISTICNTIKIILYFQVCFYSLHSTSNPRQNHPEQHPFTRSTILTASPGPWYRELSFFSLLSSSVVVGVAGTAPVGVLAVGVLGTCNQSLKPENTQPHFGMHAHISQSQTPNKPHDFVFHPSNSNQGHDEHTSSAGLRTGATAILSTGC